MSEWPWPSVTASAYISWQASRSGEARSASLAARIDGSKTSDAFLASFTEDGAVDDWGREFVGPVAI
jgi:hypothetical protein